MYIFSFLPRNQLPNHGLCTGDKYYWEMVPATSSTSLAPQFFAVEPADWPGSGGRRQVRLEDDNHHPKQQPGALALAEESAVLTAAIKYRWKQATSTSLCSWSSLASPSCNKCLKF